MALKERIMEFLDIKPFSRIVLQRDVLGQIIESAKESHPREFVALLEGSVSNSTLKIYGLLYQVYEASANATSIWMNLPVMSHAVGSVHSHPGSSNKPSHADLDFFSKHGAVHFIISLPYEEQSMAAYDYLGNQIEIAVE